MALTDKLTNIADAIRGKTGGTEEMTLDQMAEAIAGIETGGGSGGELDALVDRSITEFSGNITLVGDSAFRNCAELTEVDLPKVATISQNGFYNCKKLTTANIPSVTSIGNGAFIQCVALLKADFPLVTKADGSEHFYGCNKLEEVNTPLLTSIPSRYLQNCYAIPKVDFPLATSISTYVFYDCRNLSAVILRSETLCTMAATTAFGNCRHFHGTHDPNYNPNSLKDGYIYVPRALIEDYKVATNWSTLASQFRALEDYTVDGTVMGELDPNKI